VFASVSCVLMAGAAVAADQLGQNEGMFDALQEVSATAMTDDALATVEGRAAYVAHENGNYIHVLTPSGRFNDSHFEGLHGHEGIGADTYMDDARDSSHPNFVFTPSGNTAGSGFQP
jgi:hypothetical protein